MGTVFGCGIEPLADGACREIIDGVGSGEPIGLVTAGTRWLLAYCDDGVVWGRRDGDDQGWRLSTGPFPAISPALAVLSLLELRLFGPEADVLIWRRDGGFSGRRLTDEEGPPVDAPTAPANEVRILLGNKLLDGPCDGFTLVGDATGSRHAVPLDCKPAAFNGRHSPLRLNARHYFEQRASGEVRIAATRLVEVRIEEGGGR